MLTLTTKETATIIALVRAYVTGADITKHKFLYALATGDYSWPIMTATEALALAERLGDAAEEDDEIAVVTGVPEPEDLTPDERALLAKVTEAPQQRLRKGGRKRREQV